MNDVAYATARIAARFGARPQDADWHRIELQRALAALLEAARGTPLARHTAGVASGQDVHAIAAVLRGHRRALAREIADWMPAGGARRWRGSPSRRTCRCAHTLPPDVRPGRGCATTPCTGPCLPPATMPVPTTLRHARDASPPTRRSPPSRPRGAMYRRSATAGGPNGTAASRKPLRRRSPRPDCASPRTSAPSAHRPPLRVARRRGPRRRGHSQPAPPPAAPAASRAPRCRRG